jgi:DNA helicase II / ATP-dependent DNA helicase PcrA
VRTFSSGLRDPPHLRVLPRSPAASGVGRQTWQLLRGSIDATPDKAEQARNTALRSIDGHRHLRGLNPAQRSAVEDGIGDDTKSPPALLIAAGAGTGKTKTLAHRVAHLILNGADPHRLLLLTFTRRAALEMTRRAHQILAEARGDGAGRSSTKTAILPWSGTFHSVGGRLLRLHARSVGLDPSFTILDRSDSVDLLDLVRSELGLARTGSRFPRKGTCLAIYSYTVNAGFPLEETLAQNFPWCADWPGELRSLFEAYVVAKQRDNVLDYDDLLLYWRYAMAEPFVATEIRGYFDHVLVDEYQDTNRLQAKILRALRPDGSGLTVVGDDAQSIYSFRAATVRNILDFPHCFSPPAAVIALERNYRSTQPILDAANAVIAGASEQIAKTLYSTKASAERPFLAAVEDEAAQARHVADSVLDHREAGISLRRQAVLFRTAHHSDLLEIELGRRNIPFVKYGGLKFLEAAHVKDVLAILRWAENPRDGVAAFRVLQLLPGIGPATARAVLIQLSEEALAANALARFSPPAAATVLWPGLCRVFARLRDTNTPWQGQIGLVRDWYQPLLERLYDYPASRAGDLDQLEQIASGYASRERFLTELTLDPPDASGAEAGRLLLDEDYLILSTIHSAKKEWDTVFILNLVDGCIPSDMATGKPEQIDEERRLLYVAMTRAREHLHLVQPRRFYRTQQHRLGRGHVLAPRSRFLPDEILGLFTCFDGSPPSPTANGHPAGSAPRVDISIRLREMWR